MILNVILRAATKHLNQDCNCEVDVRFGPENWTKGKEILLILPRIDKSLEVLDVKRFNT